MDKKPRILLVDDEPDVLSMTKMRLDAGGYEVITAVDGLSGYKTAKSEALDLIILDIMLPGMDGYHICQLLKMDQKYRHIPVIILTARGQKEDQELAQRVGADCFMVKPYETLEFMGKIKELLGQMNKQ